MKNISLGQYYPANSYLHKGDPRIKLIMTMLFIVTSFLCKNILGFVGLLVFTALLLIVSKLPFKMIMRSVRPIIIIMAFTTLINVFWTNIKYRYIIMGANFVLLYFIMYFIQKLILKFNSLLQNFIKLNSLLYINNII